MSEKNKTTYDVDFSYQCPKTKHWVKQGTTVDLTRAEAEFLLLSKKISPAKTNKKESK
jgi:hypothetical protein